MIPATKIGGTVEGDAKRLTLANINHYESELSSHMLGIRNDNIANHGWTNSNYKDIAFINPVKIESFKYLNKRIYHNRKRYRVLIEHLKKLVKVFDQNEITHWLSRGTLLGAIRHDEIMRWSRKATMRVSRDDIAKLRSEEFAETLRNMNMMIEPLFTHTNPNYGFRIIYTPTKNGTIMTGPSADKTEFLKREPIYMTHPKFSFIDITTWDLKNPQISKLVNPIQKKNMNGVNVGIPSNPRNTLTFEFSKQTMLKKYKNVYKDDPRLNMFNLITIKEGRRMHRIPLIDYQKFLLKK